MTKRTIPVIALLASVAFATLVHAVDGVIEINQPTALEGGITASDAPGFPVTLDASGSYRLTGNLVVPDANTTAIDVSADFVSLDLNGFAIFGPGGTGSGAGVRSTGAKTTVRNGTVSGLGDDGLELGDAALVESVIASGNGGDGITTGANSLVSGNISTDNVGFGLRLGNASAWAGNSLTNNNGGGGNSQVFGSGSVPLASNLCGSGTSCDVCGDASITAPETCDDGNTTPGDGCDATCGIEHGWECSGEPSSCAEVCPNGLISAGETCDDGNIGTGDGCDASCSIEHGWECSGEPSSCSDPCSNGLISASETCDDGNTAPGDGCDQACEIEYGWECSGEPSICGEVCGNGMISVSEICDDGNTNPGDGCSATCALELGWDCSGEPTVCYNGVRVFVSSSTSNGALGGMAGADATCNSLASTAGLSGSWLAWLADSSTDPVSRFGHSDLPYRLVDGSEVAASWSDLTDGTLTAAINQLESGVTATGEIHVWTNVATDGSATSSVEHCSDWTVGGGGSVGFGQRSATDFYWTAKDVSHCGPSIRLYCFEDFTCGDSTVTRGENCDDGGSAPADGCSANCGVEPGWECSGEPSTCVEVCGNGVVTASESCDDGGTSSGDGCSSSCSQEFGWICSGEPSVCSFDGKRVFVSSNASNGNLGGVAGADATCQSRAVAASLPGTYLAWIADSTVASAPETRFTRSASPYRLVNGQVVANDWADLTDESLQRPIDRDEYNVYTPVEVWTNVNQWGAPRALSGLYSCLDWSTSAGGGGNGGHIGYSTASNYSWTNGILDYCSVSTRHLYCFEQ